MEPRPVARRRRRGPGEELDSGKKSRRRPFLSADDPKLTRIKFGAGWMGCPGQHVARMELSKVCSTVSTQRKGDAKRQPPPSLPGLGLCAADFGISLLTTGAQVVRDFDIELVDPSKEWHWMAYFTMVPSTWPVYVSKRASGGVI